MSKFDQLTSEKDTEERVWVTPERVEHVREHMDSDNEQLQADTGLTGYVIEVIKEAKKNNYYKGGKYNDRGGKRGVSKFDRLTDKMEGYLRRKSTDKERTWKDIKNKFNRKFSGAEIVPVSYVTISKWGKKLSEAT